MGTILAATIVGAVAAGGEPRAVDSAMPVPFASGSEISTFVAGVDGEASNPIAGGYGPLLVFSNSLGLVAFGADPGFILADDIHLNAVDGCALSRYEIVVSGNITGSGVGPYTVNVALYDGCPGGGGREIAGTRRRADLPDNGVYRIVVAPPESTIIPLPRSLWIGVSFTRRHAGWLGGAPALVGFSDDLFKHPFFGCGLNFGGFPRSPHGSFQADLYVREPCNRAFTGFRPSGPVRASLNPGADVLVGDDLTLEVDDCRLLNYEISLIGPGTFRIDLRTSDPGTTLPGPVMEGTEWIITDETGAQVTAKKSFDPPIVLPRSVWITVQADAAESGIALATWPARVGGTDDRYAVFGPTGWTRTSFAESGANGLFHVNLICADSPPMGACCDSYFKDANGNSICRELPRMNCPWPSDAPSAAEWIENADCQSEAFVPPCGSGACCLADGRCELRSTSECAPQQVTFQRGVDCDAPGIDCPEICVYSDLPCDAAHSTRGCIDPYCCQTVCTTAPLGPFCCQVEWDDVCVKLASDHCALGPPPNDVCFGVEGDGARPVGLPSSTEGDCVHATDAAADPGFCCHNGGDGSRGLGTVWFKFIATHDSALLHTCNSNAPATDSLLQVFAAGNPTDDASACGSLRVIGCNDDTAGCGSDSTNSRLCLHDLIVGQPYYVLVAAKGAQSLGRYRLNVSAPCSSEPTSTCGCVPGPVQWIDPPSGVVDARSPSLPTNAKSLRGISQLIVAAPAGSNRLDCWALCETAESRRPNSIADVTIEGPFTIIRLLRPITPGAATRVTYLEDADSAGVFISHPANVNGDTVAAPADILDLIDALNAVIALPWGHYSGDLDHSGLIAPADVLEEIDLLNGAGAYEPWLGSTRPSSNASCP